MRQWKHLWERVMRSRHLTSIKWISMPFQDAITLRLSKIQIISSSKWRRCTRRSLDGFADNIETEIEKLERCDLMIWQFPLWWFGLPAILKGWVDRVFAMGRTYGGDKLYGNGVFKGKRALLSFTTGGPAAAYVKGGFQGDIYAMLRPIHRGMLQFVGFEVLAPQITYGPVRMDDSQRKQLLTAYAERLKNIADESPFDVGIY